MKNISTDQDATRLILLVILFAICQKKSFSVRGGSLCSVCNRIHKNGRPRRLLKMIIFRAVVVIIPSVRGLSVFAPADDGQLLEAPVGEDEVFLEVPAGSFWDLSDGPAHEKLVEPIVDRTGTTGGQNFAELARGDPGTPAPKNPYPPGSPKALAFKKEMEKEQKEEAAFNAKTSTGSGTPAGSSGSGAGSTGSGASNSCSGVCVPAYCGCTPARKRLWTTKIPFPVARYDKQWPAKVPSHTPGNPMVPRSAGSGEVPYCLIRPGWTYVPNRQTTKTEYKVLDSVSDKQGCMGNPGLCVSKAILECEKDPSCSAITWWLGVMGHKPGNKGSVFLVKGMTMANIHTTARKHNDAIIMVKNSACKANMGPPGVKKIRGV